MDPDQDFFWSAFIFAFFQNRFSSAFHRQKFFILPRSLEGIGYQDDGEELLGVTEDAYDCEFLI